MFPKIVSEESDWSCQSLIFNISLWKFHGIDVYEGTAKRDHWQAESAMSCRLQGMESYQMLFDSSKKGKMWSGKPTARKLIWSWKDQCSSISEDDISPSMSWKEIVLLDKRTLIGEEMWIINRLKPTCQDSKIYLQDLQKIGLFWPLFCILC